MKQYKTANMVETTPLYWDCNCQDNYIHPKALNYCALCRSWSHDQPDSRPDEVERNYPFNVETAVFKPLND